MLSRISQFKKIYQAAISAILNRVWNDIALPIFSIGENLLLGKARQALIQKKKLIDNELTPQAMQSNNGIAIARLGPPIPTQTRHLTVIVPKSTRDLKEILAEIENQKDGRSIMSPFDKLLEGKSLTTLTGESAHKQRKNLVHYTGSPRKFLTVGRVIFTQMLLDWSAQKDGFVLLDSIKYLMRYVTSEYMVRGMPLTQEEENAINLGFKSIKSVLLKPYSIPRWLQFYKNQAEYKKVSSAYVSKHMEEIIEGFKKPHEHNVLADLVATEIEEIKEEKVEQRADLMNKIHQLEDTSLLVIGAMDGVYMNFVSIIFQLMKNPAIIEKLRNELDKICKIDSSSGYKTIEDSVLDGEKLPYLECVIKEGLRITSSAPFLPRYTSKGVHTKNMDIPSHSTILINLEALHFDKSFWGIDANTFRPERFLEKEVSGYFDDHFLPFAIGARQCPGFLVGLTALRLYLAELFLNYDVSPIPGQNEPIIDTESALVKDEGPGYKVVLTSRKPHIASALDFDPSLSSLRMG